MTAIPALLFFILALPPGSNPVVGQGPNDSAAASAQQATGGQATQPVAVASSARAEAYALFLQARQHEMDDDVDGAIKLYQDAARLDPSSGTILSELAGVYARQNKLREAITTAEAALKVAPDTVEAHAILGSIYAMYAQDRSARPTDAANAAEKDYATRAIDHFEAVLNARGATVGPDLLVTLGRLYLKVSAPEKAISVLTRFIDQEPDAMDGIALLAEAYSQAGRTDDAITLLARTAEQQPDFYPVLANLYERTGRWNEAADALGKAVARGTASAELKRRYAAALLGARRSGDAGKARDVLRQILDQNPKDTRAMYLLAEAQRDLNDLQAAEATARQLMAADPGGASGPYALAQVYEQEHDYRKVADTLQPVVDRIGPQDAAAAGIDLTPLLLHLGFAYLDLNEPDRAIAALQRARQGGSDNPTLDVGLVQAEMMAKRYTQAADAARKAREQHPGDSRFPRLEADALRQGGQMDRGVAILQEVQQAHPGDVTNYVALAELLMNGDRTAQAEGVLQQARSKFPDELSVLFTLGAVYERQKRYDQAEGAFKQVLARDPLHAQALNYLGYMLADRGQRLPEAVEYIRRALTIDPDNPAYLDSLGWAYFKMNRLDLAEANLRQASSDRPNDSAVQDHWGDLLLKLGRRDEAVAAWRRALAGDGQDINRAAIEAKIRTSEKK